MAPSRVGTSTGKVVRCGISKGIDASSAYSAQRTMARGSEVGASRTGRTPNPAQALDDHVPCRRGHPAPKRDAEAEPEGEPRPDQPRKPAAGEDALTEDGGPG